MLALLQQFAEHDKQAVSAFLDAHQWVPLAARSDLNIDGGYPGAQFRRVSLSAAPAIACWHAATEDLPAELRSARALRRAIELDFEQGAAGDIHCGSHVAFALCGELDLARLFPRATRGPSWSEPDTPLLRATAASLRADSVVGPLFHVSRGEAQTAIEYGFVYADFQQLSKRTAQLAEGCELVYRTKGRAHVVSASENTRSGRTALEYRFFPS